jgi:tRNA nucleotidyltransferase/poly(A) polymerase
MAQEPEGAEAQPAGVTIAGAEWLERPATRAIFRGLNREGFEARAVGGAVRNTLLGRPVSDIDFATTARPEDTIRLAQAAGLKTVPTGIEHGTITVIAEAVPFEVTTLRRDVETDGRRAVVAFGSDWAEDARRRDFTMNALYADASGRIHDPLGGLPDALSGKVRFIGDPRQRIREDYLRILRFFRFSAQYGDGVLDAEGFAACLRERAGILSLSRERIRAELLKLLAAPAAEAVTEAMEDSGLLQAILCGVTFAWRFRRLAMLDRELGREPSAVLRLAALGVEIAEDATRVADRLRLSTAERQQLEALAELHAFRRLLREEGAKVQLYRRGGRSFTDALLLDWARSADAATEAARRAMYDIATSWTPPSFPLSGADLIAEGVQPGPELGALLRELELRWLESGFVMDKPELLALARSRFRRA